MIDDVSDIAAMYDNAPEREHERLDRHQLEHDITWRYLSRYLPIAGSVLEIGSATGKYTIELARRGHPVTAVDLSKQQIERCRSQLAEERLLSDVELLVADARDLRGLENRTFDAVLLMGPMYHLVLEEDRTTALREALIHLNEGGVIMSSFVSRLGIMGDLIKNIPHWIERRSEVESILRHGRDPADKPRGGFRGYFATVSEIAPLHESVGYETILVAGLEPAISADDDIYNNLPGNQKQLWLDLLDEMSTDVSTIGASRHLLYVGLKPTG
jgi:SAM-dependent methyltransferase